MTSYDRKTSDEIYMRAVEGRVNPKAKRHTQTPLLSNHPERLVGFMHRSGDPVPLQSQPIETPKMSDSRYKRFTELNP